MNTNHTEPRPVGSLRIHRTFHLLPVAISLVLWLGLLALLVACTRYPPYSSDRVPGEESGAYDAFLENRRIARKLRVPLESGEAKLMLVVAGAWAMFAGYKLRQGQGRQVHLGWGMTVLGSATVVIGLIVLPFINARHSTPRWACIGVLRQIDGAKEWWAMENKKAVTDTPTWRDLVGKGKYIKTMPECPGSGRYTINNMGTRPTCSIAEHTIE